MKLRIKLDTLAQVSAVRRATPKHQLPSKVDRCRDKIDADRRDKTALTKWSKKVRERDEHIDRFDGKPVLKTLDAHPRRGEAHHIEPRSNRAVRYDVRNGVTLAWENHEKVERGDLVVVGSRKFTVEGRQYIDGRYAKVVARKDTKT